MDPPLQAHGPAPLHARGPPIHAHGPPPFMPMDPPLHAHGPPPSCPWTPLHAHVSCIMYHVSCIMYHVSCIMYHVSCIMYHVSCIMYHVSCIMYHVSCIMYHVSCIMYHVSCIMYHVSCIMYHVSCIMYHVSCIMYHVSCEVCVILLMYFLYMHAYHLCMCTFPMQYSTVLRLQYVILCNIVTKVWGAYCFESVRPHNVQDCTITVLYTYCIVYDISCSFCSGLCPSSCRCLGEHCISYATVSLMYDSSS